MDRHLNHDRIEESLGAFALDAMEPHEADEIRRHLEECPSCAAEVDGYHQVAALLGNTAGEAPAQVWEAIAAEIGQGRQRPRYRAPRVAGVSTQLSAERPDAGFATLRSIARRPWVLVAAAMVVAIALLSLQTVRLNDRIGSLNTTTAAVGINHLAQVALANPNAETIDLDSSRSATLTDAVVVILPSGEAYLVNKHLPALPANQTYQLWGRADTMLISLGVLGNHPGTVAFSVGRSSSYGAYAITAERAGGVVATTRPPVASSVPL